jgi:hypothetical protein
MKKHTSYFLVVLAVVCGLLVSSAFADLGLSKLAAGSQGAPAVGQAVLTAAKAVYANNTDPAVIQQQLIAILNEAVATGNESAIRYAIVAMMLAGGESHREQSITAINNSNAFTQYKSLTAVTVDAVGKLMDVSEKTGGDKGTGGGDTGKGGGEKDKGGGDKTLGGGDKTLGGGNTDAFLLGMGIDPNNPFTWGSLTGPGDNDVPATGV